MPGRASLSDIVAVEPASPPKRAALGDIVSIEASTPASATQSLFDALKVGWRRATSPLWEGPQRLGRTISDYVAAPSLADAALEEQRPGAGINRARLRGFGGGAIEGVGNVLSAATSPLDLAMTASGLGAATKLVRALPKLWTALKGAETATGAAYAAEGAHTLLTAPTLEEKALGFAELAGGAAGGVHGGRDLRRGLRSRVSPPVETSGMPSRGSMPPGVDTPAAVGIASIDDVVAVDRPPTVEPPPVVKQATFDDIVAVEPSPSQQALPPVDTSAVPKRASVEDVVAVDHLETGEQQPRLPEAGRVRDVELPTPEMDAPFTLDRETTTTPREIQPPLVEDPPAVAAPTFTAEQIQREVRRIAAEMEAMPFERGGHWQRPVGANDLESGFTHRSAGAGVYHDIVGAGGYGTRRQVQAAIDKYLGGKSATTATAKALEDVATKRLAGSYRVSRPFLPPDAGDTYRLSGEAPFEPPAPRSEDLSLEDWFTESARREQAGLPPLERAVRRRPHREHDRPSLTTWMRQLPAERTEAPQMRPTEIVTRLREGFSALPIKTGHFTQRAWGIYKPQEQVVRLKIANDLDTLAHELGHHLHDSVLGADVPYSLYRDELLRLGEDTSRSSYTVKQRLQEGQAEFTRYFLSEPDKARELAPQYAAAFEAALEQRPDIAKVLRQGQRQIVGHFALDPVDRVKSRIDFRGSEPKSASTLTERLKVAWVDDLEPLRRAVSDLNSARPAAAAEDAYVLARLARGASAKAEGFVRFGVKDRAGRQIAPALEPALKSVADHAEDFSAYLVASRAVELRGRGIESGVALKDAQETVARLHSPAFAKAREAVYAYQNGLLEYARVEGALSKDQVAAIRSLNEFYVPFQRVADAADRAVGVSNRLANRGLPVKRIKGSGLDIINPLESMIRNTHTMVDMVDKNRAMLALVRHAGAVEGGGRYIEAIPTPKEGTAFSLDQVRRAIGDALDEAGLEVESVMGPNGPQLAVNGAPVDLDTLVKVFTPAQFVKGEKGIVTVIRNGERAFYSVNDLALYDAINAIGPESAPLVINLLMRPARLLRAAATTTLGFVARNPIRDTFAATVNSRYGFKPGIDTLRGLFEYVKKGELYQDFLNSGAANATLVSADRDRVRRQLRQVGVRNASIPERAGEIITSPIELLRAVSEAMENATRLGEFKRAVAAEGRTPSGLAKAGLAARDVTLDFGRGGRLSKEANRYVAFFNAAAQGSARVAEVFKADPTGATMRAATAITLPTLALWYLNRDNPEYAEIPDWEKNTYWHIPLGQGAGFAKLPKPQVFGEIFANVPEAALQYLATTDAAAGDRLFSDRDAAWLAFMNLVPTALMPLVEVGTNFDTFRGRAIVNPFDTNLEPELQANRWTSETAKVIGKGLGVSPAKVDHLISGYGAGLARGVVQGAETGASILGLKPKAAKPTGGASRAPLVGTFYRRGLSEQAQSLERFFSDRDLLDGTVNSISQFEKNGELERARALARERKDLLTRAKSLQAADGVLRELRKGINAVFADQTMSAGRKRERLDRLYEAMVDVAREADGKPPIYSGTKARKPSLFDALRPAS